MGAEQALGLILEIVDERNSSTLYRMYRMDLGESVDWFHLAHVRDQWRGLV